MSSLSAKNLSEYEQDLINRVQVSISAADSGFSKLSPEIFTVHGMSGPKNRILLNTLCEFKGVKYLEIGCWKGSTFISALYKNNDSISSAYAIDNWSEFGGPFEEFQNNCNKYISDIPYNFFSHDCFSKDPHTFINDKINLYFYDGGHRKEDQANAFLFYNDIFEDVFIAMVDDWRDE